MNNLPGNELEPTIRRIGSPADVISSVGLALSVYGASEIDTTAGVLFFGAGRVLDLIDGHVARRTYSSQYGPKVDAIFDKLAVAAGLGGALYHEAAPEAVLAAIALHNVMNTISNVYMDRRGYEADTILSGKYAMFGHNLTFGAFVLGSAIGNTDLAAVGWGLFAASEPFAVEAGLEYGKKALNARKKTKAHHRTRR